MKVTAYKIMERNTRERLMLDLEKLLRNGEGWDVTGGVAVAYTLRESRIDGGFPILACSYLQAVVKRETTLLY